MTEQEKLVWLAGFFDGEGNVCIGRRKVVSTKSVYWQYQLHVALSQKRQEPLQVVQEILGGTYFRYESKGMTYYRWTLAAGKAVDALRKLLPYLIVKFEIASLGINFYEAYKRHDAEWRYKLQERDERGRIIKQFYPEEVLRERDEFYQKARVLNARGRADNRQPKYTGPLERFQPINRVVN